MSEQYVKESYLPWFSAVCQQVCGWRGAQSASRPFVTASAKGHVSESGHETAVIRTTSVHYRRFPVAEGSAPDGG